MKANELRIGNWVKTWTGEIIRVDAKFLYDLQNGFLAGEVSGIPTTEAWLVKLGFEKSGGDEYVKGRFVYRKQQRDIVINGFEYDYNGILISAQDMHVHEFQNLFYTIEREELEIKETVTP